MASGLDDEAAQATATATASPTTPSTSAADDAKARREARKARILGKGSDRLAKLTKQARGDEAEMLYPSSSSPSSSSPAASPATPRRAAPPQVASASPAAAAGDDVHEDPEEIDISNQGRMDAELQQAMTAFQQQQQRSQQQSVPQDPFAQMMAAMSGQGGGGGPGGAGGGGGGGPAGMPDLGQLLAALQGQQQQPGGGGMPGMDGSDPSSNMFPPGMAQFLQQQGQQQPAPASGSRFADRIFSLIHIVLFSLLGFLALSSTLSYSSSGGSPGYDQQVAAKEYREGSSAGVDGSLESQAVILKWASLAYYRPSLADAAYFELDGRWLGFQSAVVSSWAAMRCDCR